MRTPLNQPREWARSLLAALLILFLLAQTVGWMHRSLHGPENGTRLTQTGHSAATSHAPSGLDGLFASHDAPSKCKLFDAVLHPGCASAPPLVNGPAPVAPALTEPQQAAIAGQTKPYDARGPPAFRA